MFSCSCVQQGMSNCGFGYFEVKVLEEKTHQFANFRWSSEEEYAPSRLVVNRFLLVFAQQCPRCALIIKQEQLSWYNKSVQTNFDGKRQT